MGVHETPVFKELLEERRIEPRPVRHVVTHYGWRIVIAAALRVSADVCFYLLITFAVVYVTAGQGPRTGELTTLVQGAVVAGSSVAILVIPAAGVLADMVGRKPVYGAGIAGTALFAWPLFLLLDTRSPGPVIAAMVLMFVLHGLQFGPQAAMIAEIFPPRLRYSGASLGYQLAPVVAGAWAMTIGTHLLDWSHASLPIALYLAGCCAVSGIALRLLPQWPYRYEVALSYASEDRAYVGRVAAGLRRAGVSFFYDRHELASSWGQDLKEHLNTVYGGQSRFIVLFVSAHYAAKVWPRQELRVAQAEALRRQGQACLLPARLDDTSIPGLSPTIAYVDCRSTTPDELASLIVERLRSR
jgi:MFS family permease